jgi:hypothetical protein
MPGQTRCCCFAKGGLGHGSDLEGIALYDWLTCHPDGLRADWLNSPPAASPRWETIPGQASNKWRVYSMGHITYQFEEARVYYVYQM